MLNQRERIEINYTLEFASAFHFGTGLRNGLIHRAIARDKEDYIYVPGSTLKGVLRHRCEQIAALFGLSANEPHGDESGRTEADTQNRDIIVRIFGSRFLPSTLYFDDAPLSKADRENYFDGSKPGKYKARQVEDRTQVSLSRRTRTAKRGHLYTTEYGIRSLHFQGKIYGYVQGLTVDSEQPCSFAIILLLASLKSLDRLGGSKSTGAGQVNCLIDSLKLNGQAVEANDLLAWLTMLDLYQEAQEMEP